jgi:hypothetical protein
MSTETYNITGMTCDRGAAGRQIRWIAGGPAAHRGPPTPRSYFRGWP